MRIGLVSAFGILFSLLVTLPQRAVSQDTSAAYDPQEEWDGQSGPPPRGILAWSFSKTPGQPEPVDVQPGKTATTKLSFDDRAKMRSGKPAR